MKTITSTLKAKVYSSLAVAALATGVLTAPVAASGAQAADQAGGARIQIAETGTTTLAASRVSRLCVRKHFHRGHAPGYGWNHLHFYPCLKPIKAPATRSKRRS